MGRTNKSYVFILSTMRSGSTLLKALLAEAPDISHIPEFNFHKIREARHLRKLHQLSDKPILVLKKPAWFNEVHYYPRVPGLKRSKIIVLVRDVHHVVKSVKKMSLPRFESLAPGWVDDWIASSYWARVYRRLYSKFGPHQNHPHVIWVRYEDLISDPVQVTQQLFQFVGSAQEDGVSAYSTPQHFEWKWGKDDGGSTIQTLKVQPPGPESHQKRQLLQRMRRIRRVQEVRALLGYSNPEPQPQRITMPEAQTIPVPNYAGRL